MTSRGFRVVRPPTTSAVERAPPDEDSIPTNHRAKERDSIDINLETGGSGGGGIGSRSNLDQ